MPEPQKLAVRYLSTADYAHMVADGRPALLGAVRFSEAVARSDAPWPEVPVSLAPLDTREIVEVWMTPRAVTYATLDGIACGCDGSVLFGGFCVFEAPTVPLETLACDAYGRLFDVLDRSGYGHLWRVWNYIPRITATDGSMIRYHRFNLGRHQAFVSRRQTVEAAPAASALGTAAGPVAIYFLAGRQPGLAVENPRQVSAYHYPERYGPRSPTFSRGMIVPCEGLFLASGTASIVGHRSTHGGDASAQVAEIVTNLTALCGQAVLQGFATGVNRPRLKVYVRHQEPSAALRRQIESAGEAVYLAADICRSELLVEVESVYE